MIIHRWQAQHTPTETDLRAILENDGLKPYTEVKNGIGTLESVLSPFTEIRCVLEGKLSLNIRGNKVILEKGDRILIPSNTSYQMEPLEATVLLCAKNIN